MLEHGLIKIESEDIEYEAENVSHTQGQRIKDEIEEETSVSIGGVDVAELEASKNSNYYRNFNINRYLENRNKCENERNCSNVPISHRQSNNSACSIDSALASDKVDTKSCCHICALYKHQRIVLNCEYCDSNYGDMCNPKSHLQDVHKMVHLVQDTSQENAPQKSPVGLPQTSSDELLDYCGSIFKLKHQDFFIICGSSEIEYALDLFESHIPHHHIFERTRIKSETSTETIDITETYRDTMKPPELIKLEKETVTDTFLPKPSINYNESHQKDSTRTDLEPDLFQSPTQKTPKLIDKRRRSAIKTTMENEILPAIVLDESFSGDQFYVYEIKEENILEEKSLLKPIYEEQIPKRILRKNRNPLKCDKQVTNLKDKKLKCTLCELSFFKENKLSLHMHRHHSVVRLFKCSECPKGFKQKIHLKTHIRVHTGEKPFVCDICNKSFGAAPNLLHHRKTHLGEAVKNFKCEYCDKKFIRNIDCKAHIRTHTGEKPCICDICQRGFASNFNLKAHLRRYHTFPPPNTGKKPGLKPKPRIEEPAKQIKLIEAL